MKNELLPIGTVVLLESNQNAKLMIIGYNARKEDNTVKDYVSVVYPIGCIDNKTFFAFNNNEIKEVIFKGYTDKIFEIYQQQTIKNKSN